MIRELTCIVCPKGCTLKVELEGKRVIKLEGHTCKRGITYAESECISPMRTLTTTAPVSGGGIVPVKTSKPVPKELLFDCMKEVNKLRVSPDAKIGDSVLKNILGTDADIVLTRDVKI